MPPISSFMPQTAESQPQSLTVSVVVASLGRPDVLADLLALLAAQTEPAEDILLSVTGPADLPPGLRERPGLRLLVGPKGSCAQRNTALDQLPDPCDIVIFCDDDYVPSRHFVARVRAFFAANADVVGVSGRLLADGINGPGITAEAARALVAVHDAAAPEPLVPMRDRYGLYGCNMAFRRAAIGAVRFDERLPLYGWQEDIDFAAQVRRQGRIVSTHGFAGVHRGVKQGRSPGVRVGYSQIVNPAYLAAKGTMRAQYGLRIALRNFLANHARALRPEPWVDRRGRAWGNWLALADLLRGRITPERIIEL
jgi:GT2 family glycosyltransferase